MKRLAEYKVRIEYNESPAYHPITVSVKHAYDGDEEEFNGRKLKPLLRLVNDFIVKQEAEEGY